MQSGKSLESPQAFHARMQAYLKEAQELAHRARNVDTAHHMRIIGSDEALKLREAINFQAEAMEPPTLQRGRTVLPSGNIAVLIGRKRPGDPKIVIKPPTFKPTS